MELLNVLFDLIQSICCLLRNLKWNVQRIWESIDNRAAGCVWFSCCCSCFLQKFADDHVFHRSGSGAVGSWAHIWEAVACLWRQGQLLHELIHSTLHTSVWLVLWLRERCMLFFYSLGVQWQQRAAVCETKSSGTHHHRLRCKYYHITASLLMPLHQDRCRNINKNNVMYSTQARLCGSWSTTEV